MRIERVFLVYQLLIDLHLLSKPGLQDGDLCLCCTDGSFEVVEACSEFANVDLFSVDSSREVGNVLLVHGYDILVHVLLHLGLLLLGSLVSIQ